MKATKIPDKIDFEISKTYFRNTSKKGDKSQQSDDIRKLLQQNHFKKIAKRSITKKIPAKKQSGSLAQFMPFFLITLFVVCVFILAAWLIKQKHIMFTVSVKVEKPQNGNLNSTAGNTIAPGKSANPVPVSSLSTTDNSSFVVAIPSISTPIQKIKPKPVLRPDKTLYDFEKDLDGWEIPHWARDKKDHVARTIKKTCFTAYNGTGSLKIFTDFPKKEWTAAIVEIQQYLDLTNYNSLSANIYMPLDGPKAEIRGKLIITSGENWDFIEMKRSVRLEPGKWITLKANIAEGSQDWQDITIDNHITSDIRKVAIRIESYNTPYTGPIYIDNIQVLSN
ncbi:MAG: hypothetical protein ISS33_02355 [Candidatus Omnitrophica bacterium]|nr:hypothetical protein [Candidatus Omnitrophota bacterium]